TFPGLNEILSVDRQLFGLYLTGGVQVLPELRVRGGLVYSRSTEYLTQGLNILSSQGQIDLATAGGVLSYDVSAEVTPLRDLPLTVAIDYKHQGVQKLTGHAHAEGLPLALQPRLLDQGVTHVLTYPNQLNAGYFHAFYDTTTAVGPEAFPGTYETHTNIYALNITWKMGERK